MIIERIDSPSSSKATRLSPLKPLGRTSAVDRDAGRGPGARDVEPSVVLVHNGHALFAQHTPEVLAWCLGLSPAELSFGEDLLHADQRCCLARQETAERRPARR